jgi:hypothetical protein
MLLVLILSFAVGESFSGQAKIDGIGEIALPPGRWTLEHVATPEKKTNKPDVYVFKKEGDRLERLTIQKFGPHISHPLSNYFDSIGDSTSNGIPVQLLDRKNEHDTAHILRPLVVRERSGGKDTCLASSYIYTSETKDPWMSHAFVCDRDGLVLVCVHSSPHVISPETVDEVFAESRFDRGTSEPADKGRTKR